MILERTMIDTRTTYAQSMKMNICFISENPSQPSMFTVIATIPTTASYLVPRECAKANK